MRDIYRYSSSKELMQAIDASKPVYSPLQYVDGRGSVKTLPKKNKYDTELLAFAGRRKADKSILVMYRCKVCEQESGPAAWTETKGTCKSCSNTENVKLRKNLGLTQHKAYFSWDSMMQRCTNPNNASYEYYGDVGVTICEEWLGTSRFFLAWADENGFKPGLVLDKDILCDKLGISPKVYSPETCQWITKAENARYSANRSYTCIKKAM